MLKVVSPLDGSDIEVKKIREHPQFPSKFVVESLADGFQFTHPLPSVEELTKVYAEDYNAMFGRDPSVIPPFVSRRAAAQWNFMKEHIGEEELQSLKIIGEAGAGWGQLSRTVSSYLPDAKLTTYELDHDSVKSMKDSGMDARYGMLEVEETEDEKFDLIMGSHVTEHFLEPRNVFEKIHKVLRPGGFLFLEIPLENPVPTWWGINPEKPYWVGHLYFFAVGHLEKMLKSLDYEIVNKSGHDHPHSPGFVMPGSSSLYDVESVPIEKDTEISNGKFPKALRLLARRKY